MLKESRNIKTADDFNEEAVAILEEFLEGFTEANRLIRPVDEEDDLEAQEVFSFMYTDRGNTLASRMIDRLHRVGARHFDPLDIDINSYMFREI